MLELKAFVQESVHALDDAGLRGLCDTLRVDSRGCDDRRDVERILTGLLCLDKDTALGTFLTWLRTRETAQAHGGGLLARKSAFLNTFVPVISPRRAGAATENHVSNNNQENAVKEHHLSDEILTRLEELKLLEQDFKDAERQVHSGTPSFDKLKAFLVKLTKLRTKEEEVRRFFIKQSELLTQQHTQMKDETLHTRAQLDFFVDGFTNLRHRHDELVEASTRMKAENEVAQDVFLSITAQESHFGAVLHRTMLHMLEEKRQLTSELEEARREIAKLKEKQKQLEQLVSRLKKERGDALKDASSYKLQLRKCKHKMDTLATDGPDIVYFRDQAIQLRGALTTLLTLFREAIARDTKSAKQSLSKEVLRAVQNALLAPPAAPQANLSSSRSRAMAATSGKDEHRGRQPQAVARVVEKKSIVGQDLDEVVRGVVLLGGQEGEAASCASALSTKLRYVPLDVKATLEQLRDEAAQESQRLTQAAAAVMLEKSADGGTSASPAVLPPVSVAPSPAPPTVENYLPLLQRTIAKLQAGRNAKGVVLFNYELTAHDANLLIGAGVPIDSVLDLKLAPPPPPPPTPAPQQPPATPTTKGKAAATPKGPTSRAAGPAGGTRPASKAAATPSSPSRPASRQPTADTAKKSTPPTATPATSSAKPTAKPVDRKAAFTSMPQAFAQLAPVAFIEDRVDQVLQEIARQKRARETPFVAWDETTSQVNESLLMYAEDVHMMIWIEQDIRRPKNPGQDASKPATPASSSSSSGANAGSTSPTRAGASSQAKAPAKGKATSPTRSPGQPSSPTKPAPKGHAASPSKPKAAAVPAPASLKKPAISSTSSSPGKRKAK